MWVQSTLLDAGEVGKPLYFRDPVFTCAAGKLTFDKVKTGYCGKIKVRMDHSTIEELLDLFGTNVAVIGGPSRSGIWKFNLLAPIPVTEFVTHRGCSHKPPFDFISFESGKRVIFVDG